MLNKSFARRVGKKLSIRKKYLIDNELKKFEITIANLNIFFQEDKEVILEVGFGMGEHFIEQFLNNKDKLYIGAEPYLNGVGNVLEVLVENKVENVKLIPDSIDIILPEINSEAISHLYILFPDPWNKRKQNKNRLINSTRAKLFYKILKKKAILTFASDIEDYIKESRIIFENEGFVLISDMPHENYIETKYHKKAIREERKIQFLHFIKN